MQDYSAEIARGIALLNRYYPGWYRKVDLDSLDLSRCDDCVLGQLAGEYNAGRVNLRLSFYACASYGFNIVFRPDPDELNTLIALRKDYQGLTAQWKEAIRVLCLKHSQENTDVDSTVVSAPPKAVQPVYADL